LDLHNRARPLEKKNHESLAWQRIILPHVKKSFLMVDLWKFGGSLAGVHLAPLTVL
jgi:hypothetical protein